MTGVFIQNGGELRFYSVFYLKRCEYFQNIIKLIKYQGISKYGIYYIIWMTDVKSHFCGKLSGEFTGTGNAGISVLLS